MLILLLAGWTWPSPKAATVVPSSGSPLAAILKAKQPRRIVPTDRVPGELPFIEPETAGRLAYAGGDLESALERFTEEIRRRPSDAESYSNAGQVLIRLGRTADALPFLEEAVALDDMRWAYRFNL
ncbi:MAG: tetratricopeptide repeat protein, partial [Acidobacteria bacterium]